LECSVEYVSDDVDGQVKARYIRLDGRMIQIQFGWEPDHFPPTREHCLLWQRDIKIYEEVCPDEHNLVTEDKVFWCMLLGELDSFDYYSLLVVVKQIDGSADFERVGYVGDFSHAGSLWDDVERTQTRLL
jgi:hypothetical protein